jgi:two-component system, NtrC family, sensor kinase
MKQKAPQLCILILFSFFFCSKGMGQPVVALPRVVDSLIAVLAKSPADTNKVKNLVQLARIYTTTKSALTLKYGNEALLLSRQLKYQFGEMISLRAMAFVFAITGKWPQATEFTFKALKISESKFPVYTISLCNIMAEVELKQNQLEKALEWSLKAYRHPMFSTADPIEYYWVAYMQLGSAYANLNKLDSATFFLQKADETVNKYNLLGPKGYVQRTLGKLATKRGNYTEARKKIHASLLIAQKTSNQFFVVENHLELARAFHKSNLSDSAIHYAKLGLKGAALFNNDAMIAAGNQILAEELEAKNPQAAIGNYKKFTAANNRLYNTEKLIQTQNVVYAEQQRIRDLAATKIDYQHAIRQNTLLGILTTFVLLSVALFRNNRQKQKANALLAKQRDEIQLQKQTLQSTQAQLIQSEKLASLGELTAGIAHEIQNPLNFVNNFAEVSEEMLVEMEEELDKGDTAEVKAIAADLKQNLSKINHHGKRASSIVKGMLEHSRASTGVKEPTDLNALADEYLRLAYHGLRAKDSSFNATMETHFDPDLPKIEVIPQDIGRVLLNLINNAFFAVNEKAKQGIAGYQPTVMISSRKLETSIEVRVEDNGNGIPEAIKDKIFQPFFTTKPTGQGTGLGLSLTYDIVTKGHGGMLTVSSIPEKETTFEIQLPINETPQ